MTVKIADECLEPFAGLESGKKWSAVLYEEALKVPLKTPKRFHCKSKKRFIKLMIASGIERNTAQSLAAYVAWTNQSEYRLGRKMSFQKYYEQILKYGYIRM